MPTWDQTADMEEGDLTDFNVTVGSVAATTGSKFAGSYGMDATVSIVSAYGELSGPTAEVRLTAECQWDVNTASFGAGAVGIIQMIGTVPATIAIVQARLNAGNYQVRVAAFDDAAGATISSYVTVTDAFHLLRLVWRASTGAGANNGMAALYVDNVLVKTVTAIDSDTLTGASVQFGSKDAPAGFSGNMYFDDCRVANESEFIFFATGAISDISGVITKAGAKSLVGAISSIVGTITKAGAKSLTGAIAMAGAIERSYIPHVITAWAVARQRRPTVAYKPPEGGLGSIVEPLVLRNAAEPTNFLILRGYDDEQLSVRSQAQGRQLSVARVRRPAHARPSREDAE